ncbi:MAG: DNA polymerase III subunit delta [Micrococcales bacterium]|nr:DNA polymerase III subunit delta [Micrococcales bacterium]
MSPAKEVKWREAVIAPVVLVFGPQEFFADRAIKKLRSEFSKGEAVDVVEIDSAEYTEGSIFDLASAGLFGESKVVIFDGVERCSDALITDGIEYLANVSEDSMVIFRHTGKSVRGKKLLETLRANDSVVEVTCAELSKEWERVAFVESEFLSNGRKIQKPAAAALADIFGKDLEELAAACSQLQLDDAGEITPEIVAKYFKVADAAMASQTSEALLLLRHCLEQGVDEVQVISALARKVGEIARVLGNPKATFQSIGVPDWVFAKVRQNSAGWTEDALANVIHQLAEVDFAVKGGNKDEAYALERLVRLISNKGRAVE